MTAINLTPYTAEAFPYLPDDLPPLPSDTFDATADDDPCPCFMRPGHYWLLYVDHPEPEARSFSGAARYSIFHVDAEGESHWRRSSDHWEPIAEIMAEIEAVGPRSVDG